MKLESYFVGFVLCAGLVTFGLINWHCYIRPIQPIFIKDEPAESAAWKRDEYDRKMTEANEGRDAVIPFVVAPPLTIMAFMGMILCIVGVVSELEDRLQK